MDDKSFLVSIMVNVIDKDDSVNILRSKNLLIDQVKTADGEKDGDY